MRQNTVEMRVRIHKTRRAHLSTCLENGSVRVHLAQGIVFRHCCNPAVLHAYSRAKTRRLQGADDQPFGEDEK